MTASLPHPGQRTPSGQRCWRTSAKHLASSNSSERLTRSDEGMTARAPCATAAADQPPASSQQKPHATATRSPASQHPGSQQEPQEFSMNNRPQSWEELRRMECAEATESLPNELRELVNEQGPPKREIHLLKRSALTEVDEKAREQLTLEGYRPPWLGISYSPKRAHIPKPPQVLHHDQRLEPPITYEPDERKVYNDR